MMNPRTVAHLCWRSDSATASAECVFYLRVFCSSQRHRLTSSSSASCLSSLERCASRNEASGSLKNYSHSSTYPTSSAGGARLDPGNTTLPSSFSLLAAHGFIAMTGESVPSSHRYVLNSFIVYMLSPQSPPFSRELHEVPQTIPVKDVNVGSSDRGERDETRTDD